MAVGLVSLVASKVTEGVANEIDSEAAVVEEAVVFRNGVPVLKAGD